MSLTKDQFFMQQAIESALNGCYTARPNPMVGCLIVKDDIVIGQGAHIRAGSNHAEINALEDCHNKNLNPNDATVYVTLEPCSHFGRTPPCVDALIKANIKQVIIGSLDPNPKVAGKGVTILKSSGIDVQVNCLKEQCQTINAGFFKRMLFGLPLVRVKSAISIDGRTAMANGQSKWITKEESRLDVQKLRAKSGAIITGIGTVLHDKPQLNIREDSWQEKPIYAIKQPLRVILDSHLRIPLDAPILNNPEEVLLVTVQSVDSIKKKQLLERKIKVISLANHDNTSVCLSSLLAYLADKEINEILVEAGSILAGAFIEENLVDEIWVYMAPIIMGSKAKPLYSLTIEDMKLKYHFDFSDVTKIGDDIRFIGKNIRKNENVVKSPS